MRAAGGHEAVIGDRAELPVRNPLALEVRGVSKRFPGVHALDRVDLDVRPGEVHVLLGENGAGKSTLMKILQRRLRPRRGPDPHRRAGGRAARSAARPDARDQHHLPEFSQAPHLTVAQNLFLGREPLTRWRPIDARKTRAMSREALAPVGLAVDPDDADQAAERGAAPDGGDRQGAQPGRQDRHHGRADVGADRPRDAAPVRDHPQPQGAGRARHLHLAPPRGGRAGRRSRHGAPRRAADRHPRRGAGRRRPG